jgi:hypothetical protein
MKLLPHVWNLLGKKSVQARIVFGEPITATGDRKRLSAVLHEEVAQLHDELRANQPTEPAPVPVTVLHST